MPLFEYKCPKCDHEFEELRRSDDRDLPAKCEKCDGDAKRRISVTSFTLKGGGWAADGYSK